MHSFLYNIWGLVTSQILYPYAEYKIGRQILPKLRTLRQEAKLPFSKRRTLAQQRLASTLEAAGADVPYYRDLFRTARFDPVKVRNDVRYLNELPYLTKEILREQGTRLVNEKYANLVIREQKTGSSTGPAAIVRYDQESLDWTAAQNILMLDGAANTAVTVKRIFQPCLLLRCLRRPSIMKNANALFLIDVIFTLEALMMPHRNNCSWICVRRMRG